MSTFSLSTCALKGKPRGTDPVVHLRLRPKLVFYPGERKLENGKVSGTIYVLVGGELVKRYPARGGPKEAYEDGKHWAMPTPPGTYKLGPRHHHVTTRWYRSTIPWGAEIRQARNGVIEYRQGGVWKPATGKRGKLTRAYLAETGESLTPADLEKKERKWFDVDDKYPIGELVKTWKRNDFGEWAFGLLSQGRPTDYYIHTTAPDEADFAAVPPLPISLSESHGCIHIKPSDRDEMWKAGYLAAGNTIVVKGYDEVGPP